MYSYPYNVRIKIAKYKVYQIQVQIVLKHFLIELAKMYLPPG